MENFHATISQVSLKIAMTMSHLCIAPHSRPCTARSQHLRHACLHRVPRHCICFFFWFKSASTVLRAFAHCEYPCKIDHVVVDWSCWKLPSRLRDAVRGGRHSPHRWAIRSSSRLLPISRARWKLSPQFQEDLSDSRQTDGCRMCRRSSELLRASESTKAVCCPPPVPRKKNG